jgi:hypothetical protein
MKCETKFEFDNKRKSIWYHMFCALSNSYVFFSDLRKMEGLKINPMISGHEWHKYECEYCNEMDYAYFLTQETTLDGSKSKMNFHPMCAWLEGLEFSMEIETAK